MTDLGLYQLNAIFCGSCLLSVPMKMIVFKNLSLKRPVVCRAGCKTTTAHSLYVVQLKLFYFSEKTSTIVNFALLRHSGCRRIRTSAASLALLCYLKLRLLFICLPFTCDAGHLPQKQHDYRRKYRTLASTYVTFSPDGNELLVNLGGEQIYLFDVNKRQLPQRFDISIRQKINPAVQSDFKGSLAFALLLFLLL